MKQRLRAVIIIYFVVILVCVAIYVLKVPCLISQGTGLYCAGCGTGRMIESILHLDFASAIEYNPFMFVMIPIIAVLSVVESYFYVKRGTLFSSMPSRWFITLAIISALVFSVMRNLDGFVYLTP